MEQAKNIIEEHKEKQGEIDSLTDLLEESNIAITSAINENRELAEKLSESNSKVSELETQLEELSSKNDSLEEAVEKLTQEESSLEVKVMETCNELGVQPVSLGAVDTEIDYVAEFSQISDPAEKTKFYRAHKNKILGGN